MADILGNIIGQLKDHNKKQLTVAEKTLSSIDEQQERLTNKLEGMVNILNAGGSLNAAQLSVLEENLGVTDKSAEGIKVFLDDINVVFDQQKLELEDIKVVLEGGGVLQEQQLRTLEDISADTVSKEDKMETRNEQEKLRDLLAHIADKISIVASKAEKAEKGVVDKTGIIATIAALGLAVFSPKTLVDGFESFTQFLMDTSSFFAKWFSEEGATWDDTLGYLEEHWKGFLFTVGAIAVKFGVISKIIGLVSSAVSALAGGGGVLGVLSSMAGGLATAFGVLISPVAATAALVVLIGKSIWDAFGVFGDLRDKGASLTEALSGAASEFMATLIGLPLDLLKSVVSWFADILGFENFSKILDEFSFEDSLRGIFNDVIVTVRDFFKSMFDFIPSFDDIKGGLYDSLPEWAQKIVGEEDSTVQRQQALESAEESGMYDPSWTGLGNSDIDRNIISTQASVEQINAILATGKLTDTDTKYLQDLVKEKTVQLESVKERRDSSLSTKEVETVSSISGRLSPLFTTENLSTSAAASITNISKNVKGGDKALYNTLGFDGGYVTPLPSSTSIPGFIPTQSLETSSLSISNVSAPGTVERASDPVSKVRTALASNTELESESKQIQSQTQRETKTMLAHIANKSGGGGNNISNNSSSNTTINNAVFPDNVVPSFTMRYSY